MDSLLCLSPRCIKHPKALVDEPKQNHWTVLKTRARVSISEKINHRKVVQVTAYEITMHIYPIFYFVFAVNLLFLTIISSEVLPDYLRCHVYLHQR